MGALCEAHFDGELENRGKLDSIEREPETTKIEEAVSVLLKGLGEDVNREGIRKTPFRVAKALREGTRGYGQNVKEIVQGALFPEAGGVPVFHRDVDLFSYCESCLLPFQVKCHVGYIPSGERVVGFSKLVRVVDVFARRLQDPQRLANEVCTALQLEIEPEGVAVILQCRHIPFPNLESVLDSNHKRWVKLTVSSGSGVFENHNADAWTYFLSLIKFNVEDLSSRDSTNRYWCPSCTSCWKTCNGPVTCEMISAVSSIIRSLGEDPSREELVGTPSRFLKWLMNFQNIKLDTKLNGLGCRRVDPLLKVEGSFNEENIYRELSLSFWSQCEHHLLPFYGVVHIAYYYTEGLSPIGRSLLQSIVHFYGFKLQVQERLTRQVAERVSSLLGGDVMVVVEASHTCMMSRGIEKVGTSTATIATLGRFSTDPAARAVLLQSIPKATSWGE